MKNGKYVKIGAHKNIRIGYGTTDFKDLKSIFINLISWVEPKVEVDYEKMALKLQKQIKTFLYNNETQFFHNESIVDLDIKHKGVMLNKKSFMNLDITLFVNKPVNFKSKEFKTSVERISKDIISDILTNEKNNLNFNKTKNIKMV
jgi:hypothetical protein